MTVNPSFLNAPTTAHLLVDDDDKYIMLKIFVFFIYFIHCYMYAQRVPRLRSG